ncbi:MAG: hypothetical protein Q9223_007041 [Gallowayella weberi]
MHPTLPLDPLQPQKPIHSLHQTWLRKPESGSTRKQIFIQRPTTSYSLEDREQRIHAILQERASTCTQNRQPDRFLYIQDQLYRLRAVNLKTTSGTQFWFTDCVTAIATGRRLAELYMRRQNWFQAQRILEGLLGFPGPGESLNGVLDELVGLYKRFVRRIEAMTDNLRIDHRRAVAYTAILDRVVRIDVDELSKFVFDGWWDGSITWHYQIALHFAAAHNACNTAHLALNRGANVDGSFSQHPYPVRLDGYWFRDSTPLQIAAEHGCFEMVKLLVLKGAHIEANFRSLLKKLSMTT